MISPDFKIDKFIEELLGSCLSLDVALSRFDMDYSDLTEEHNAAIDNEIFLCSDCDWWCELPEMSEDGLCESCKEAQEDSDRLCEDIKKVEENVIEGR